MGGAALFNVALYETGATPFLLLPRESDTPKDTALSPSRPWD